MKPLNSQAPEAELQRLAEKNTVFQKGGFTVRLEEDAARWDRVIRQLGREPAYARMAALICRMFREKTGEEFLFSDECVAYELLIHIDIYLRGEGYPGYPLHVESLPFPKPLLRSRTKDVDIYPSDARDLKQRVVFRYRSGIRACYQGTEKDPFRRKMNGKANG